MPVDDDLPSTVRRGGQWLAMYLKRKFHFHLSTPVPSQPQRPTLQAYPGTCSEGSAFCGCTSTAARRAAPSAARTVRRPLSAAL